MKKFKVVKVYMTDKKCGLKVGDIVEFKYIEDELYLCKLPKHLWGNGHGGSRYSSWNYKWLSPEQLEEIKENK